MRFLQMNLVKSDKNFPHRLLSNDSLHSAPWAPHLSQQNLNLRSECREGDWICFACSNLNYSFRKVCNRCKTQSRKANDEIISQISFQNEKNNNDVLEEKPIGENFFQEFPNLMKVLNNDEETVEDGSEGYLCEEDDQQLSIVNKRIMEYLDLDD